MRWLLDVFLQQPPFCHCHTLWRVTGDHWHAYPGPSPAKCRGDGRLTSSFGFGRSMSVLLGRATVLRSSHLSHALRAPSPVHRLCTHHWGHLYHSEDGPPSRCVLEFRIRHDSTVCWNVGGHAARFVPDVDRTFLDQHPTFVAIDDGADAMSTQQLHAPRARFRH
jgi:hypothetical protein